jgi:hypothetical protein
MTVSAWIICGLSTVAPGLWKIQSRKACGLKYAPITPPAMWSEPYPSLSPSMITGWLDGVFARSAVTIFWKSANVVGNVG